MPVGYPKKPYRIGAACAPTIPAGERRVHDKPVALQGELPGTVILVHGVNDVGTGYAAVEKGLCEGLSERLSRNDLAAAEYRLPTEADKKRVLGDPDAVFFRRNPATSGRSPVIPFYWGFREDERALLGAEPTAHGQRLDRYGNRLDRDGAKGGGPFNNATSSIPDLWARGARRRLPAGKAGDALDATLGLNTNVLSGDPLRPVLDSPPRNYMVLAAERLAMLVRMIRQYDADETVSIITHSQGGMVALLAQALLAESKLPDSRPADTLVLTHSTYSLGEPWLERLEFWATQQTLAARADTLAAIVQAVHGRSCARPAFATLHERGSGMTGCTWAPGQAQRWVEGRPDTVFAERDNRGRVYLYFCPEDMTVGLANVQGIGWQGVPDRLIDERALNADAGVARRVQAAGPAAGRAPHTLAGLEVLAAQGFCQRAFTMSRPEAGGTTREPMPVGGAPGAKLRLRLTPYEDTRGHVAPSGRTLRHSLPLAERTINAPALPRPYAPNLLAGTVAGPRDPMEPVDPIDAAIATTNGGIGVIEALHPDPLPERKLPDARERSPVKRSDAHSGSFVRLSLGAQRELEQKLFAGKPASERPRTLYAAYAQVRSRNTDAAARRGAVEVELVATGQVLLERDETAEEAQRRWLDAKAPISFHGAIFGNAENHRQVTAYDVAIGQGKAVSDPLFYRYLCEVADWRMKRVRQRGVDEAGRAYETFLKEFGAFLAVEPKEHRELVERVVDYYTNGAPIEGDDCKLKVAAMPQMVVSETVEQRRQRERQR